MGSPLVSAEFRRLLDERLTDVTDGVAENMELESMIPKLYGMATSKKAWEEFFGVGDIPDIPEFNGQLEYLSVAPGYHTKVEHKEYAGGLQYQRQLIDDKLYGVLDNHSAGLMKSAYRTKEKLGVRAFAYAFSAAFDFMTSEENVALCSSSHTTKSGVSTASGFDNAGTSALSASSVASTRLLMRQFRTDIGERYEISDRLALLVPDTLVDTALEIVGTDKGLYSGEGTKNVQQGRYEVIGYKRLDDYDTNNWFMVDLDAMKRDLMWFDRIKPEMNNTVDFETFVLKSSIYFRCSYGFRNWRWIYGHQVS